MKILFKPTKQWWEFWKKERLLEKGVDYEVSHGRVIFMKALDGEIEFRY